MLKIKNNVGLKELEQFGFKIDKTLVARYKLANTEIYSRVTDDSELLVVINKEIRIYVDDEYYECFTSQNTLDVLYDLIEAGLVEKEV